MSEHPFIEYHENSTIGNLMWRIERRREMLSDSQDGSQIESLREKLTCDRAELKQLEADYEKKTI